MCVLEREEEGGRERERERQRESERERERLTLRSFSTLCACPPRTACRGMQACVSARRFLSCERERVSLAKEGSPSAAEDVRGL